MLGGMFQKICLPGKANFSHGKKNFASTAMVMALHIMKGQVDTILIMTEAYWASLYANLQHKAMFSHSKNNFASTAIVLQIMKGQVDTILIMTGTNWASLQVNLKASFAYISQSQASQTN